MWSVLLLPVVASATELTVWHTWRGEEQAAIEAAGRAWGERG